MKFYELLERLSAVKRCQVYPTLRSQSVAEHSFNVAMLSGKIAEEIDCDKGSDLYFEVISKALFHDFEESIVGDIPWHVKHHNYKLNDKLHEASVDFMKDELTADEFVTWNNAKKCESGMLVNLVDMVEFCLWTGEEIKLGNSRVEEIFLTGYKFIENLIKNDKIIIGFMESSPTLVQLIDEIGDIYSDFVCVNGVK